MHSPNRIAVLAAFLAGLLCPAIAGPARADPPLHLEATILLPNVAGRIDHMAVDLRRKRLFVAELGNNSVDVIDLGAGRPIHRITRLPEPQGIAYVPQADVVVVANAGDGTVRLFRGGDYAPAGSVALGSDADNVRSDPRDGSVLVGYGSGGLAILDPATATKIAQIPLPAHPEAFALDPAADRVFVNVPDASRIVVADLKQRRAIAQWHVAGAAANFPMALDPAEHRLAVVFRSPSLLVLLDSRDGHVIARAPNCKDADDVFFDSPRNRLYISCGGGEIAVFTTDSAVLHNLASVRTAAGARTSLFVPELDRLFVARRAAMLGTGAAILVYRPIP